MQYEPEGRLLRQCGDGALEHSLKVEAIHGERFVTRELAKAQVFEYIEAYYNRMRSWLGYLSPDTLEARQAA